MLVVVIPGHNLGNSQVSVNRSIGPTLVDLVLTTVNTSKTNIIVFRKGEGCTRFEFYFQWGKILKSLSNFRIYLNSVYIWRILSSNSENVVWPSTEGYIRHE